jgi:hypothetical protein
VKGVVAAALLAGALATAGAAVGSGDRAGAGLSGRSFTVAAAAFPVDPAPGTNDTSLAVRPVAVRAQRSAPPDAAYARSAFVDPGTAELYTGPPPEGSFAECDTGLENQPREAEVQPGTTKLLVSCADPAEVVATATGASPGGQQSFRSEVRIRSGPDRLSATAVAETAGVEIGPLRMGSARYTAYAETDGRAGAARGVVEVSDATVAGVPVRIASDGIAVDRTKVPLELLAAAADAVHRALAASGYFGARVVQPATEVSDDGSHVSVVGGGVELLARSNDPRNNYYLRFTFVGGELRIDLGVPEEAVPELPEPPTPSRPPASVGAVSTPTAAVPEPAPPTAAPARPEEAVRVVPVEHRSELPARWPGVGWLVAIAVLVPPGLLVASWRFPRLRESLAERYVRG